MKKYRLLVGIGLGSIVVVASLLFVIGEPQQKMSIAPMHDEDRFVYHSSEGRQLSFDWLPEQSQAVGPFDAFVECRYLVITTFSGSVKRCIDASTGEMVTAQVLGAGVYLGGLPRPYYEVSPPGSSELLLIGFAGKELSPKSSGTWFLSGRELHWSVTSVDDGRIVIVLEDRNWAWNSESTGFVPRESSWRLVFNESGPAPVTAESRTDGPWRLRWSLVEHEQKGKPMAAWTLPTSRQACAHCAFLPYTGFLRSRTIPGIWGPVAAQGQALQHPEVAEFANRASNLSIVKATFQKEQRRDAILGPLGVPFEVHEWRFVFADGQTGETLEVLTTQRQDNENVTVEVVDRKQSNYRGNPSIWPAELLDPGSALSKVLAKGGSLESLFFNPVLDPFFFDPAERLLRVSDPSVRNDMTPNYLYWHAVIGYPDGGAETFDFSASNGQWLYLPHSYGP